MLHWDEYLGSSGNKAKRSQTQTASKGKGTSLMLTLIPWIAFWVAAAIDNFVGPMIAIGVCALTSLIFFNSLGKYQIQSRKKEQLIPKIKLL